MPFLPALPAWAITASTIISSVGTIASTVGSIMQAQGQAKVAENQAKLAMAQGALALRQQRRKAEKIMGAQEAAYGAAGVELGTGTPVAVMTDTARELALDAAIIKWNAKARAGVYESMADQYESMIPGLALGGLAKAGGILTEGAYLQKKAPGSSSTATAGSSEDLSAWQWQ
jgi:hypothetical protein